VSHRQTPASCSKFDRENQSVQPGTPSRLRQPSPLKDLWARSQAAAVEAAAAGQSSPSKPVLPSPSPLKMHLFGTARRPFPKFLDAHRVFHPQPPTLAAKSKKIPLYLNRYLGSQLPQSRLPMPKSWALPTSAPM
jgi:hypothetical protein